MSETHRDPALIVNAAPFLRRGLTIPRLMLDVVFSLLPVFGAAVWFFGLSAIAVTLATVAGCVAMEAVLGKRQALHDVSALVTGVILAMSLPPSLPMWMAFIGGAVAIGLGKLVWGGMGHNLFNPALVGRAFLQAAFPTALTTWSAPAMGRILATHPSNFSLPFTHVDVVTTATPLAKMKFENKLTAWLPLFLGNVSGSLGETSALAILFGGAYLLLRRAFDWRIPASILLTVAAFAQILHMVNPARYPGPLFMLLSGGLLYGAVFMATDPVTSPITPRGAWIFGVGIGVLVVLIRLFGGLPEGVMYSILLMNAVSPLIDRYVKPRPFGRRSAKVP